MGEVILGWILGVLSTPLVMYCTSEVERRRFKNVLIEELREVRFRLIASIYLLRTHLGSVDRSSLQWMTEELNAYKDKSEQEKLISGINGLLQLSDVQLVALANHGRNPLNSKSFPRVVLPYLSSKVDSVSLLKSNKQKELINLLHYVEVINVKGEELAYWNQHTFVATSNANHTLASGNADTSMQAIIQSAEKAVGCIKNYLS